MRTATELPRRSVWGFGDPPHRTASAGLPKEGCDLIWVGALLLLDCTSASGQLLGPGDGTRGRSSRSEGWRVTRVIPRYGTSFAQRADKRAE
jgi:hypothetical protein